MTETIPDLRRPNEWYGYRRDGRDPRDRVFRVMRSGESKLPRAVDLRKWMPPVMDQGALGSCVANAVTAALRYEAIRKRRPDVPLSRLQNYFDARVVERTVSEDSGVEIRDAIKCAAKIGVGLEERWPYDTGKFAEYPDPLCYQSALPFNAIAYERVEVNPLAIKQALARTRHPVIIGIAVFSSFDSVGAEPGVIPTPNVKKERYEGGHAMLVVGYGQRAGYFTVRNSWGSDWGDGGDCYIHEDYIGSPKLGGDYWVIRKIG